MAHGDPRYVRINDLWASAPKPAIGRAEAAAMVKLLCDTFGLRSLGGPLMARKFVTRKVRACWLDPVGNGGLSKGWQRLAHDISHMINRKRHPNFAPHDNTQAILEWEIACFVVSLLIIEHNQLTE